MAHAYFTRCQEKQFHDKKQNKICHYRRYKERTPNGRENQSPGNKSRNKLEKSSGFYWISGKYSVEEVIHK